MEVKILQESLPIIKINYDELKAELTETLNLYKGIIVTEVSLKECKEAQKELASTRVTIDNYRKDKKKELTKPITDFENLCKELIGLVEKTEAPIKIGINVFDDMKREEKRQIALRISKEVIEQQELNEKYAARLNLIDRYSNLSIKESEVRSDLELRAMALKIDQDRELELINIIKSTIDFENVKLYSKLRFEDYQRYIDMGIGTTEVLNMIRTNADKIFQAENPPKVEEQVNVPTEQVIAPKTIIEPVKETIYFAEYKIIGNLNKLRNVSKFLKDNGIEYQVLNQGEIE